MDGCGYAAMTVTRMRCRTFLEEDNNNKDDPSLYIRRRPFGQNCLPIIAVIQKCIPATGYNNKMVKKGTDLESGDKAPLLSSDDEDNDSNNMKDSDRPSDKVREAVSAVPHSDVKDAAFWLFMLFIASVTMTVGNKVRTHARIDRREEGVHTRLSFRFNGGILGFMGIFLASKEARVYLHLTLRLGCLTLFLSQSIRCDDDTSNDFLLT